MSALQEQSARRVYVIGHIGRDAEVIAVEVLEVGNASHSVDHTVNALKGESVTVLCSL